MVVDDDPLILEILGQQLESFGVATTLTVESGDAAIARLRAGDAPTVLLTDVTMPEMDGARFLRLLAEVSCRAQIVLVSGAAEGVVSATAQLGRTLGLRIAGQLTKPVSPEVLRSLLETITSRPESSSGTVDAVGARVEVPAGERLRQAIAQGEIHPWYQPQVDGRHLRVRGVEALARWRLPDSRLVLPAEFLPDIERAGLAGDLFASILRRVLADLADWHRHGFRLRAAINLSGSCCAAPGFPDAVAAAIGAAGVEPAQITFEFAERELVGSGAALRATLDRLAATGCGLSIDDFGAAGIDLTALAELPFSEVKVDAACAHHGPANRPGESPVDAVATVGRGLAMEVVGKCVERHAGLDAWRRNDVGIIQGYLIARPMPGPQFLQWLAAWRPGVADRPGTSRPLSILVVDERPDDRSRIEHMIRERIAGGELFAASTAYEAETIVASRPIDGAIVDFHTPGLDGLRVLQRLRERCPAARFALLSAAPVDAVGREAVALGALYCPKPLAAAQADRIAGFFVRP